jgi:hypothetical protein
MKQMTVVILSMTIGAAAVGAAVATYEPAKKTDMTTTRPAGETVAMKPKKDQARLTLMDCGERRDVLKNGVIVGCEK